MPPLQVHISTEEEQTSEGERTVTLTGTPESVLLAQFLVQSNIDLFKKDHQQVSLRLHPSYGNSQQFSVLQGGFLDSSFPGSGDSLRPPDGMSPMMGGPPSGPQRGERSKGPNQNFNGPPNQNFGGARGGNGGGGPNMGGGGQRPPMQGGGPMGGAGGDRGAFGRGGGGGRRSPQFEGGPPGGQVGPMGPGGLGVHGGGGPGGPGARRGGGSGGGKQQQKQGGRRRN